MKRRKAKTDSQVIFISLTILCALNMKSYRTNNLLKSCEKSRHYLLHIHNKSQQPTNLGTLYFITIITKKDKSQHN